MPGWDALLGAGSVAEQLLVWGVLNQLIGDLLGPAIELVRENINAANPVFALSPADLAESVVRRFMDQQTAAAEAARNGINADRFATMVALAADAPGPQQLAEALRRGLIVEQGAGVESTSFDQGIAEGRLGNKWAPMIKGLAQIWPSPTDALDALLQGQVSQGEAEQLYQLLGGDMQFFTWLFNTRGSAPTPLEAIEMANRGIIPWDGTGPEAVSYRQAFLEGPWRNKWEGPYRALGVYVPPPRTVTTLIHDGAISDAQALAFFQAQGMSPELAAAYVKSAHATKTSRAKELAESTVLTLYQSHALSEKEAADHLAALGYDAQDVGLLLEVTDLQREASVLNSQVNRVGTLYVNHKITRRAAADALAALGATPTHSAHLMADWDVYIASNVKQLTPAQIVDAWEYKNMTQEQALTALEHVGYTPFDAWVLLSNKAKGPLKGKPPETVGGPGVNP